MKRTLLLFLGLFALSGLSAQDMPAPRAVEKAYRSEYREALRAEEAAIQDLEQAGWDIVLPIEERVPTAVSDGMGVQAIDHWAEGILIPENLKARIIAECVEPVLLKVSDTGVDQTHPELAGNWWLPKSDYTGDAPTYHLHGSHVAGISFSLLENLIKGGKVQLKDCRVLNTQGAGNFSWGASMVATERAQDTEYERKGVHVVYNMSWGGQAPIQAAMEKELETSSKLGVLFVAAAGNNGTEVPSYPASSAWVLATASLDKSLTVSSYSTRGTFVDNAMPGREINSTVPGGGFATLSGTSMASPMLAAAVVIAKSKYGDRIPDGAAMHRYLAAIATDIAPDGWDKAAGWGIPYFYKILDTRPEDVIGSPPPPPPPPPPGELSTVTMDGEGYFMRWQYSGEKTYRIIYIPYLRLTYTAGKPGEALYDEMKAWLPTYFKNRALLLSRNMSGPEAAYYTGRFLELIAADQAMRVDVVEIQATDEQGRTFFVEVGANAPKVVPKGEKVSIIPIE
jgi:hypothetical protein